MRDEIKSELENMESLGVVNRKLDTQLTDWVSSIVYSRKSSGQLRICLHNFEVHHHFFFSSGCSRHLGSPLWLLIVSFQFALSPSSPSLSPTVCMSFLHTSFHLAFGLPLFLSPVSLSSSLSSLLYCNSRYMPHQ